MFSVKDYLISGNILPNTKHVNRYTCHMQIYPNVMVQSSSRYEYDYTRLEIFYKAPKFMTMQRSELFGLTDFMANCGGLLGLFLGFSFLSVIEIVYFCTLRCVWIQCPELIGVTEFMADCHELP